MQLNPGTRIGPYEILEALGAGGMGQVYRARDSRLQRDVAIKILPDIFAADPDRLARFEREARALAALNHSNIAQIYGIEERALVMELVAGEDLAQRLERGPIPLDEALAIGRQIAQALDAAHERGIVHRDLKPANVKVRADGTVKVLDFGLARALDPGLASSNPALSPTFTSPATQLGVIVGTAAYMAPEQASGKAVDKRADIWAFGVVLYEMLTGRRPFGGESVSETLAEVLKSDPDMTAIDRIAPPRVRGLIAACLRKDPRARLRDIGDATLLFDAPNGSQPSSPSPSRSRLVHVVWAVACAAAATIGALVGGFKETSPQLPHRRFDLTLAPTVAAEANSAAISHDGSKVAYVGLGRLWIHDLSGGESREVIGVSGATRPFWSSDSQWIAFGAARRLWKASAGGGTAVAIADLPEDFTAAAGGAWLADGRIIFTTGFTGLVEVSDRGGDLRVVLPVNQETDLDFHEVSALPGNRGVVFYVHARPGHAGGLEVFDGKQRKPVMRDKDLVFDHPVYSPSGHLLYRRTPTNAGIWALPFSLDTLEPTGTPFLVLAGDHVPSVANDGTLVASVGGSGLGQPARLTWVDRSGAVVGAVGDPEPRLQGPVISPDGRRAVVATAAGVIWVYDLTRGTRAKVTLDSGLNVEPAWMPDGLRVVHVTRPSWEKGLPRIVLRAADGSGAVTPLAEGDRPTVSVDGRHLVYTTYGGRPDIMRIDLRAPGAPVAVVNEEAASEREPALSPDGRWLAFTSDTSGHDEVYMTSFPGAERKWQISTGGGAGPHWRADGRELLYLAGDTLMAVTITPGTTFSFGSPAKLFGATRLSAGYDVTRDGKRFLTVPPLVGEVKTITVIQNWFAEFQRQ